MVRQFGGRELGKRVDVALSGVSVSPPALSSGFGRLAGHVHQSGGAVAAPAPLISQHWTPGYSGGPDTFTLFIDLDPEREPLPAGWEYVGGRHRTGATFVPWEAVGVVAALSDRISFSAAGLPGETHNFRVWARRVGASHLDKETDDWVAALGGTQSFLLPTVTPDPEPPTLTTAPTLTGDPVVGGAGITFSAAVWAGAVGTPTDVLFVGGVQRSSGYVPTSGDVGAEIMVRSTATNPDGTTVADTVIGMVAASGSVVWGNQALTIWMGA